MTVSINWMWLTRIAKVLALLFFLLPWLAVSCNGTPLIEASGLQMATGNPTIADFPMAEASSNKTNMDPAWWVIVAAVVILAGLGASLGLKRGNPGARLALASSVLALLLLGGGMASGAHKMRAALDEAMQEETGEADAMTRNMAAMMANTIKIEIKAGYWLTLIMLGAAGGAAFMAQSGAVALPSRRHSLSTETADEM